MAAAAAAGSGGTGARARRGRRLAQRRAPAVVGEASVRLLRYDALPSYESSDHKPVVAEFAVEYQPSEAARQADGEPTKARSRAKGTVEGPPPERPRRTRVDAGELAAAACAAAAARAASAICLVMWGSHCPVFDSLTHSCPLAPIWSAWPPSALLAGGWTWTLLSCCRESPQPQPQPETVMRPSSYSCSTPRAPITAGNLKTRD